MKYWRSDSVSSWLAKDNRLLIVFLSLWIIWISHSSLLSCFTSVESLCVRVRVCVCVCLCVCNQRLLRSWASSLKYTLLARLYHVWIIIGCKRHFSELNAALNYTGAWSKTQALFGTFMTEFTLKCVILYK